MDKNQKNVGFNLEAYNNLKEFQRKLAAEKNKDFTLSEALMFAIKNCDIKKSS
jgi:hypothetical protein